MTKWSKIYHKMVKEVRLRNIQIQFAKPNSRIRVLKNFAKFTREHLAKDSF